MCVYIYIHVYTYIHFSIRFAIENLPPAVDPRLLEDLSLGQVAGAAQRSSTHRGIDVVATLQNAWASECRGIPWFCQRLVWLRGPKKHHFSWYQGNIHHGTSKTFW